MPLPDVNTAASHDFWRFVCCQSFALDLATVRIGSTAKLMSIQDRCLQQRPLADRAFMDFKYTPAGSLEQRGALARLHALILQWIELESGSCSLGHEETSRGHQDLLTHSLGL